MNGTVQVERCEDYHPGHLQKALASFAPLFDRHLSPGQTVALKPNWLAPHHRYDPGEWQSVITHPNVITAVLTEVAQRLGNSGKVVIADAPQSDTSFAALSNRFDREAWTRIAREHGVALEIIDLRDHEFVVRDGVTLDRRNLPGDPLGSVEFNLGAESEFTSHQPSSRGYYGADYDTEETTEGHSDGDHRYRISRSVVAADVFINLPKWKTHKKAGMTCSLKNLVGINTYKNFLPHHNQGTPAMGGDQFPDSGIRSSLETVLLERFKKLLGRGERYAGAWLPVKRVGRWAFGDTRNQTRNGSWYGNDTLWRMILDLNKLLLYGNPDGSLREPTLSTRKPYLSIVDGVIAGEGTGPEAPTPLRAGLLFGGEDPVAVDCVAARLMGFDWTRIPSLSHSFDARKYAVTPLRYSDIGLASQTMHGAEGPLIHLAAEEGLTFEPHFGWRGQVELERPNAA